MDICSFIFSTKSLFKVKELLKMHIHLSLAIFSNILRLKDTGLWSVERKASISVFFYSFLQLIRDKKSYHVFNVSILSVTLTKTKTFFCWILDSANITQLKTFNYFNHFCDRFFFRVAFSPLASNFELKWKLKSPLLLCSYF